MVVVQELPDLCILFLKQKHGFLGCEMAQNVNVLVTKPEDLSFTETHMLKSEN